MNDIEKAIKIITRASVLKLNDTLVTSHDFTDEMFEEAKPNDVVLTLDTEDLNTFYVTKDEFDQVTVNESTITLVTTDGDTIDIEGFALSKVLV
jgi:hypothetical protein